MSGSVCGICLQSFHEVDPDTFQVASLDSCNHRFCLKCIKCWAKIKTSCPTCRTAFKYVDSSTGKRFECKAQVPTPSASESEPEESFSDFDSDILGVTENSDQYLSDDGFVVNDNVIQYDTDYEADVLQDDECSEELIDLRVETYAANDIDEQPGNHDGVVITERCPRRINVPQFKAAIERFEEMRWKRRKIESPCDSTHTQQSPGFPQALAHGSKFFLSQTNDAGKERPDRRPLSRIQQAESESDSDDMHGSSSSENRESKLTGAVADGAQVKEGGWLSRLKTHVKTPATFQRNSRQS